MTSYFPSYLFLLVFLQLADIFDPLHLTFYCSTFYHLILFNIVCYLETWSIHSKLLIIFIYAFISRYPSSLPFHSLFSFSSQILYFSFHLLLLPFPLPSSPSLMFSVSVSLTYYFKEALMWARERHLSNLFLSRWWNMPTGDTRLLQQNNLERRWRITFPAVTVYDDGLAKVVYWSWCLRQTIHMQSHLYFNIIVQGREDVNLQVCFGKKIFFKFHPLLYD